MLAQRCIHFRHPARRRWLQRLEAHATRRMCRLRWSVPLDLPTPLAPFKRFFGKKFTTPNMIYRSTDWRSVRGHQSSSTEAAAVHGHTQRRPHRQSVLATTHHELKTLLTSGTGKDSKDVVEVVKRSSLFTDRVNAIIYNVNN